MVFYIAADAAVLCRKTKARTNLLTIPMDLVAFVIISLFARKKKCLKNNDYYHILVPLVAAECKNFVSCLFDVAICILRFQFE